MKMSRQYREYRSWSGMAKFEKECRLTGLNGKEMKAYKVPGTPEHGTHCMYKTEAERIAKKNGWKLYE